MERRSRAGEEVASVLMGWQLSRRAFLQAMTVVGIAVTGIPGGVLAAAGQNDSEVYPKASPVATDRIADLAAALFYDVDEIYRFVADSIRYEPYAGILRGAEGTLSAQAGNSADQAALLAALLDASLINYRFALGKLDTQAADSMLVSAVSDAATIERQSLDALAGALPGLPPPVPEFDPDVQAAMDRAEASADHVVGWAREQVANTMSDIQTALSVAGMALPGSFSGMPDRELDQHIWVQVAQGADWVDLDPSLPGNPPGQALTTAAESLAELPDDLRHSVELAVIGEHMNGDDVSTRSHLKLTAWADRVAGLPITFVNTDPAGIEQLAAAVTPMDGVKSYVPMIVLGEVGYAGDPIEFGQAGALEADFLSSDSLFGGSSSGETTAEWLQVTIASPDRDPVVAKRTMFDRFGPAARAAGVPDVGALRPATEIVLEDGSTEVLDALASTWLAVGVGLPDSQAPVTHQDDDDNGAAAVFAQAQHVFRELGDLVLGLPLGVRSFHDAPNLVGYAVVPRTGSDGTERVQAAIDIWHRSHGTLPVEGTDTSAPPAALAGALDHVVERVIGGEAADRSALAPASVGAVFDAARRQGVEFRVLTGADQVEALGYPSDAEVKLRASLADGWLAVAPGEPVSLVEETRVGWWLVDPATGRTVDELDDGRGAPEYVIVQAPGQISKKTLRTLARKCLAGSALYAATMLQTAILGKYYDELTPGEVFAAGGGIAQTGGASIPLLTECLQGATLK